MYKIIITLDYELHGNGDGSPYKLMIEPTYRMMKLFDKYGAKLTIMADVAAILKFKEYYDKFGIDKYYYKDIVKQLKDAVLSGHDVQLHIHSSYFGASFKENGIAQNWDEYDLTKQSFNEISNKIKICKEFLEQTLKPVRHNYRCNVYRAANWSMMPTKNISKALIDNGIEIDSSVFKWGKRSGRVNFDYTNSPDKLKPWFFSSNNVCEIDSNGELLEIPIYAELRYFTAFISPIRLYRMFISLFHRHPAYNENLIPLKKIGKGLFNLFSKHAWKLDINQSNSFQLVNALKRIKSGYNADENLPIVLIGHSKSFIKFNEINLHKFLKFVNKNPNIYSFSKFENVDIKKYR